jgi:NAD(P)-dependent dehydrogenase (short-subunit alcohol dehydrogenase family)
VAVDAGRFEGKVVVVTGGANGNGRAFVESFAAEGAKVAIMDRDLEAATALADTLTGFGRQGFAVSCDVRNPSDIRVAVEQIRATLGEIDVLIGNAGVLHEALFDDVTEADWDFVFDVNVKGLFFCVQAMAQSLRQTSGSVVLIASNNVVYTNPLIISYCASKGAVATLTKALARALAPDSVRVNALAPGTVATDMARTWLEDPTHLETTLQRIPLGRVAEPDDLVGAAKFLASSESSYITGATLFVDGGSTT